MRKRPKPPELPIPKRPYRDSAVFYAILAVCVVTVAALTSGELVRAVVVAVAFFVVATGWSWWRWRSQLAERSKR